MADSAAVDQLLELLGGSQRVSRTRAQRLLADANGSIETAVSIFYSGASGSAAAPPAGGNAAADKIAALRAVLGSDVSEQHCRRLIGAAEGSVEAAIELHFSGEQCLLLVHKWGCRPWQSATVTSGMQLPSTSRRMLLQGNASWCCASCAQVKALAALEQGPWLRARKLRSWMSTAPAARMMRSVRIL